MHLFSEDRMFNSINRIGYPFLLALWILGRNIHWLYVPSKLPQPQLPQSEPTCEILVCGSMSTSAEITRQHKKECAAFHD